MRRWAEGVDILGKREMKEQNHGPLERGTTVLRLENLSEIVKAKSSIFLLS